MSDFSSSMDARVRVSAEIVDLCVVSALEYDAVVLRRQGVLPSSSDLSDRSRDPRRTDRRRYRQASSQRDMKVTYTSWLVRIWIVDDTGHSGENRHRRSAASCLCAVRTYAAGQGVLRVIVLTVGTQCYTCLLALAEAASG